MQQTEQFHIVLSIYLCHALSFKNHAYHYSDWKKHSITSHEASSVQCILFIQRLDLYTTWQVNLPGLKNNTNLGLSMRLIEHRSKQCAHSEFPGCNDTVSLIITVSGSSYRSLGAPGLSLSDQLEKSYWEQWRQPKASGLARSICTGKNTWKPSVTLKCKQYKMQAFTAELIICSPHPRASKDGYVSYLRPAPPTCKQCSCMCEVKIFKIFDAHTDQPYFCAKPYKVTQFFFVVKIWHGNIKLRICTIQLVLQLLLHSLRSWLILSS